MRKTNPQTNKNAWKFSECAAVEKPDNETTRLLEKAQAGKRLSREEKDRVANILYGPFRSQSSQYQLAGWQWDMHKCLARFLVQFTHDRAFHPYYAPDKTSLRKALNMPIQEIVTAPMRRT